MADRESHRELNLSHAGPRDAAGQTLWNPGRLAELVGHLAGPGGAALAAVATGDLLEAWASTVESFRDRGGAERAALDPQLVHTTGLSPRGLAAALETVLAGVAREPAARLLARARPLDRPTPALVVLAGNVPALGVQALLPALALRRPVLLKSPSAEPFFLPAFVGALARRQPLLSEGVAVAAWRGGERALEQAVLDGVGRVLAYGDAATLDDLARRAPGKVVGQGPKASVALVGADASPDETAAGLARDIALFDQRGCLSVHAVYVAGPAGAFAARLAGELARLASELPPGSAPLAVRAAVRQLRDEAALRGLVVPALDFGDGTVIVEPQPEFRPSPGLRTVRVHPVRDLAAALVALRPWRGRLQGVALAGDSAWALRAGLEALGVSRLAGAGELQSVDASWANGGIDPLEALG